MSHKLIAAADDAIECARNDNSVVGGHNEPSEVARLVNALPRNLVQKWSPFVASGAMTVTAAFCHAKPRVRWASPLLGRVKSHEPELADLLLMMNVQGKQRALLVQVKKTKSKRMQCNLTSESELVQRYMYSDWPQFEVLGAIARNAGSPLNNVDISTPTSLKNLQSRYAVVGSVGATNSGWYLEQAAAAFALPKSPQQQAATFKSIGNVSVSGLQSLGEGIFDLYIGKIGRDCSGTGDWSELVKFLNAYVSQHTASSRLPHVKASNNASPRPLTSAMSFLAAPLSFVEYSGNEHVPNSQWMDSNLFQRELNGGAFYRWPRHNHPSEPSETKCAPEKGFGIIRIVVDHPLKINE